METPETQTASLSAAEKFIKQQEEDQHSADYYKVDNKQRVVVEDSIIDDVNANIGDVSENAEKSRIIALKANEASGKNTNKHNKLTSPTDKIGGFLTCHQD